MNRLPLAKRVEIVGLLLEGKPMGVVAQAAGVSVNTVAKLLGEVGAAACDVQDRALRGLASRRLQIQCTWTFVDVETPPRALALATGRQSDIWTWTAMDVDTGLVACWHVGRRTPTASRDFAADLARRVDGPLRVAFDGDQVHLDAAGGVHDQAAANVLDEPGSACCGGQCLDGPLQEPGVGPLEVAAWFDQKYFCSRCAERRGLTMRRHAHDLARLPGKLASKAERHMHAISLHFMHRNFACAETPDGVTPAMKARVTDHAWSKEEIVRLAPDPASPRLQVA